MPTHDAASSCPICHAPNGAATNAFENHYAAPSKGDVGVCISCAGVFIFDPEGNYPLGSEEFAGLSVEERSEIIAAQQAVKALG